jgi:hypothetical protein
MLVTSFKEQVVLLLKCSEQVLDQRCLETGIHPIVKIKLFQHSVMVVFKSLFYNFPHVLEQLGLEEKRFVTFF